MARKWMRFRSITLMLVIALIAGGLGGYRWYQDALVKAKIDRAIAIIRAYNPKFDATQYDPILGVKATDGKSQKVHLSRRFDLIPSREGNQHVVVTIMLDSLGRPVPSPLPPRRSEATGGAGSMIPWDESGQMKPNVIPANL